ncbi:MAG: hypothetical protein WC876_02365 [Candidatus Thermoplasmatota archaeon]|jgi:hypothetical protein
MKTKTISASLLLFAMTALAAVSVAPTASAHYCMDTNAAPSCGGCADRPSLLEFHYHTKSGVFQCASVGEVGVGGLSAMSVSDVVAGFGF